MHILELPAVRRSAKIDAVSAEPSNVVAFPTTSPGIVLIPDGLYVVAFDRYKLAKKFGRGALELQFKVMAYGDHFEKPLSRYYKVLLEGKRTFRAPLHGAFNREFMAVFRKAPPAGITGV